jgi:hypothetical protein
MEELFLSNWAFIATSLVLAFVGQVLKNTAFSKATILRYQKKAIGELLWWMRKTLPVHPVAIGAAIGLIPGMPVPAEVTTPAAGMLYYAFAGVMSTWGFSTIRSIAKSRGIELEIPGERSTSVPPGSTAPAAPTPPPPPDLPAP